MTISLPRNECRLFVSGVYRKWATNVWWFTMLSHVQYIPWIVRTVGVLSLHWRHNGPDGVSNHQPHYCLPNHLFKRRTKKTLKLRVTGLCVRGIHRWPVNSPHKWPVTRKMFPFDDVIMLLVVVVYYVTTLPIFARVIFMRLKLTYE